MATNSKVQKSTPKKKRKQPSTQADNKRPLESIQELVGLISAGAGIFVVLLYLAGRSFASGYFAAMNIPSYQVSFSLWEYGEVAWRPMILYSTIMSGISGVLWTAIFGIRDFAAPLISRIGRWLKKLLKIKLPIWLRPEFSLHTRRLYSFTLFTLLVFMFIYIINGFLGLVEERGRLSGQNYVVEKAPQVELITSFPMALDEDDLSPVQSSGQNYYVYNSFHLLTFNDGKYYLFKEINPVTCKPLKVYVINAELNLQVNLLPAESLVDKCQRIVNPQSIITPTTVPTLP